MRVVTGLIGIAFVAIVFVVLPRAFIGLNQQLGWPRWWTEASEFVGWVMIGVGLVSLIGLSSLFRRRGHGTPIPIEPPTELVTSGPYRWSRNPMYVADLTVLLGIFLAYGHAALLLYAAIFAALIQALLVLYEEPILRRRFGASYDRYCARVPRWIRLP